MTLKVKVKVTLTFMTLSLRAASVYVWKRVKGEGVWKPVPAVRQDLAIDQLMQLCSDDIKPPQGVGCSCRGRWRQGTKIRNT